jgi:predicted DNA-binding transcriptional regulator AlpA
LAWVGLAVRVVRLPHESHTFRGVAGAAVLATSFSDRPSSMAERLLNARELGELLGLSTSTVLDWFVAGRLPGFKLGAGAAAPVRFRASECEAWWRGAGVGRGLGRRRVAVLAMSRPEPFALLAEPLAKLRYPVA